DRWLEKADLDSLELLGSVGEPINPEAWKWLFEKVGRGKCPLVDTWWQTETGGIMISPAPGIELLPLKPGSASWPMPGIDATVVDDAGKPSPTGEKGHLMIRKPWPGMMLTVYNDAERYKSTYWERFPGCYETGDFAVCDSEGYFWVLGRSDEVLKVAGHRLGASEIESACVSHPAVAESAAVGVPDDIKGESIVVFATLKEGHTASDELAQDLKQHLRTVIGAVATPKHIYFAKQLPKTRSGKIMRRLMKAIIADQPLGDTSTIEDEASTEEVKRAYKQFKTILKG
ncbi:MAG: AMP-binding protein, partial [Terriglobia bacterium]